MERADRVMRQGVERVFPAAVLLIKQYGDVIFQRAYGWLDPEAKRQPTQPDTVPYPWEIPDDARAARLAAFYERLAFAAPPGRQIIYSDIGFILLGEAIARLSGMSPAAYLKQAVLEPLGMKHTVYNPLAQGVSPERLAPAEFCRWRRRRCRGEVHDENAACLGGVAGHAGLFAPAEDVAALGQLYLNNGRLGQTRLFSPLLAAEATQEQAVWGGERRGLGWLRLSSDSPVGRSMSANSYGHTGFTGTSLWVDPDRELVVVLLTNRVYYGRDPHGIKNFRIRLHNAVTADLKA